MKIRIKARAKSRRNHVEQTGVTSYTVWVTEAPEKGKANQAIRRALSDFLGVPASKLSWVSGETSSQKVIEVLE